MAGLLHPRLPRGLAVALSQRVALIHRTPQSQKTSLRRLGQPIRLFSADCTALNQTQALTQSDSQSQSGSQSQAQTPGVSVFGSFDAADLYRLRKLRNIGISAHIDSGKTTLTERILYYTGRIREIHDVRGKDGVGAKMDSMELEREKGITIQSAATYTEWDLFGHLKDPATVLIDAQDKSKPAAKDYNINIIDTPGHVDFTIEVERSLRVLDGAVLVLCAVGGVQSQTITVDRQMKRYNVPRICFVNKMDRAGANPTRVIDQMRQKLGLNAAAVQIPIGIEGDFQGVCDLVRWKAYYNDGEKGDILREAEIPDDLINLAKEKRQEFVGAMAEVDEEICDYFISEGDIPEETLVNAIRRTTIARAFTPVFMGSAYHNKSVQPLLDGVCLYLPSPHEVRNTALDQRKAEERVDLSSASNENLVALAFKLEEGRFGQLTYLRIYQGTLKRGMFITNVKTGKKIKVPRLVRMHSNEMEDIEEVGGGEICALFGVECSSGDTFTDGKVDYTMTSMYVPPPVISLSITPKKDSPNFSKALNRFQKEDPTFRVHVDSESKETIISGMGELHLDIYVERMKREYGVECATGKPQVAFREAITKKEKFYYTHKKQSGGSGQFGRVVGYIEPICADEVEEALEGEEGEEASLDKANSIIDNEFVNATVGMNIPGQYIPAIEKGFLEACERGFLIGHPIRGVRFVLEDGLAHAVDSSELAFKLAAMGAFKDAFNKAGAQILEPLMSVAVSAPAEYQGTLVSLLNKRKGTIHDSNVHEQYVEVTADVPLNDMFGFSTDLRSATQGKGEFSMEYKMHSPVYPNVQEELIKQYTGSKK